MAGVKANCFCCGGTMEPYVLSWDVQPCHPPLGAGYWPCMAAFTHLPIVADTLWHKVAKALPQPEVLAEGVMIAAALDDRE